jgi:hypothetical protein
MLFDIVNGKPQIIIEDLTVPEFRAVWESSKDKKIVELKLLYIYHLVDPKSPYANKPEHERGPLVQKLYVKGWAIDSVVIKAIAAYKSLYKTASMRYLEGVEIQIDKLGKYLRDSEPTDKNINSILRAITEGSDILTSYAALKERIDKELSAKKNIKKNITPNIFEEDFK